MANDGRSTGSRSMRLTTPLNLALVVALLVAACGGASSDTARAPDRAEAAGEATSVSTPTEPPEAAPTAPPPTEAPATEPSDVATPEPAVVAPPEPAEQDAGAIKEEALQLSLLHAEPDPVNGGRVFDATGREVLLRGVNVNSYAEYWEGTIHPAVVPFTSDDADQIANYGWNVVRLLFTWSLVEPEPGVYDDAYLDELEEVVRMLEQRGIYTILDSHQDAWSATLAARPDEVCDEGSTPAVGWDGAPAWATLVADETPRCAVDNTRELSPAVGEAANAFFTNQIGPGDVGIRTRYASMWGYVAERFANDPAIAGYDIMNEPNAFFADEQKAGLAAMYTESLAEIRRGEAAAGGESHIVLFEPWALWSSIGQGAPEQWDFDENIAYSPHLYEGAFTGDPLTSAWFDTAVEEAAMFGGAPIITGEWGPAIDAHRGTQRTGPDGDGYFLDHQNFQDQLHIGSTLWMWDEGCGDPHRVNRDEQTRTEPPFEVECTGVPIIERPVLTQELTRGYPWFSPGRLASTRYDHATGSLDVNGDDAEVGQRLVVFYPTAKHGDPQLVVSGLDEPVIIDAPGGSSYIVATTTDSDWSLSIS